MSRSDSHKFADAATIAAAYTSASFLTKDYNEATFYITIGAAPTGTTPTLDFDIETSPDDTNWFKDSDVPQIDENNYSAVPVHKVTGSLGKYIRVTAPAPGGTTPSFTSVTIQAVVKET